MWDFIGTIWDQIPAGIRTFLVVAAPLLGVGFLFLRFWNELLSFLEKLKNLFSKKSGSDGATRRKFEKVSLSLSDAVDENKKKQERIDSLEGQLRALKEAGDAGISAEKIEQAQAALANDDTEKAEEIFLDLIGSNVDAQAIARQASAHFGLGQIAHGKHEFDTAEAYFMRALDLSPENGEYLYFTVWLYLDVGKYDQAVEYGKKLLALETSKYGETSPQVLRTKNILAMGYQKQGDYEAAEPLLNQALAGVQKVFGLDHPATLASLNNLGMLYKSQGRYEEAEPLLKDALAGRQKALGPERPDTLSSLNNLGLLYESQGRYEEAEPLLKDALAGRQKALGPEHAHTLNSLNNLGLLYESQGRYEEAEPLLKDALAGRQKALGPERPDTLTSLNSLGMLYKSQGRYEEAEPLLTQALAGVQKVFGPDHLNTALIRATLEVLRENMNSAGETNK